MKRKMLVAVLLMTTAGAYAQQQMASTELANQISQGKSLVYENVSFVGDIDLSNLGTSTPTAQYPENGKTAVVLSNFVRQPVSFKNCTFKGKFTLCSKTESAVEIKEYRVEFTENVIFQNCIFEKDTNFELVNFDKAVSFEGSVFKEQPRFVRMGIYQKPNIQGLKLEKDCLFQFDRF